MADEDVKIHVASGETEAQQVRAFLEAHGVPCRFRGESLRMTHGFTLDGLGAVEIFVPAEIEEEARKLLQQVESGELALPDEDDLPNDV